MSTPKVTTYYQVNINGSPGFVTQERLYFSASRIVHCHMHQFQLQFRYGVSDHGIWGQDNEKYGNQTMYILSYADRAIRRIRNNSSKIRNVLHQGNRTVYNIKLSTTDNIGRSVGPNLTGQGVRTAWVDTARIVLEAPFLHNGVNLTPVITFFPVE